MNKIKVVVRLSADIVVEIDDKEFAKEGLKRQVEDDPQSFINKHADLRNTLKVQIFNVV